MANLDVREKNLSIESETAYGTDVIAGSPEVYFSVIGDAPTTSPQRVVIEDESVKAFHSGNPHKTYASHNDIAFETYLRGKSGAAGTASAQSAILKASGFDEELDTGDSTYKPITHHTMATAPSMTVYEDVFNTAGTARRAITTGVYGNATFTLEMDTFARLSFAGIGLFGQLAEPASTTPAALSATDGGKPPLVVRGLTLTIDSDTYCVQAMELSTNWSVEEDRGACGASSLKQVILKRGAASRIGGSLTFRDPALLTKILASYGADAIYDYSAVLSNGTDTVTISGKLQFGQYERTGGNLMNYSVPYFCLPNTGNDDISIVYT